MKIGVDLRVLQVGHQYRGIGEVAKRTLNEIFALAESQPERPSFVFFEYDAPTDPKQFLDIPAYLQYTEVDMGIMPSPEVSRPLSDKLASRWRDLFGNPVPQARACDVFLQFDYALGIPTNARSLLIEHDIIPYIFWNDYFTSPWLHVKHKAARTTLRTMLHNYEYKRVLKRSLRHASEIVCVSEHTRQDLMKYLAVPPAKLKVIHLGVSPATLKGSSDKAAAMPTKPYLLFIGAVDARRRRIDELISAYNNLKADGQDIQLVLAGENFQSPDTIPNEIVRQAAQQSSYKEDILTMGYIDDATKYTLFKNALAFVFPTTYEGFGIPVLEAMMLDCPVIAYRNSSVAEIGGGYALYAKDWETIKSQVEHLQTMDTETRQKFIADAKDHAGQFSWQETGRRLMAELLGS